MVHFWFPLLILMSMYICFSFKKISAYHRWRCCHWSEAECLPLIPPAGWRSILWAWRPPADHTVLKSVPGSPAVSGDELKCHYRMLLLPRTAAKCTYKAQLYIDSSCLCSFCAHNWPFTSNSGSIILKYWCSFSVFEQLKNNKLLISIKSLVCWLLQTITETSFAIDFRVNVNIHLKMWFITVLPMYFKGLKVVKNLLDKSSSKIPYSECSLQT